MPSHPSVFVAFRPSLYALLFPDQVDQALHQLGQVVFQEEERSLSSGELAARLPGFDAVLTSWVTPKFTEEVLDAADRLKIIAHSAGSIKLLRALEAEVWVYDPYLGKERAAELGVTRVDLDALFAGCPVVSVQAPSTPETYHMIGEKQLRLLKDGACFINTARSWAIDYDALLAELQTGRIWAALDVFDQEPLPVDNPFRALDNVILTPHIAGASIQARRRQGQFMVEELGRFFRDEALRYGVTRDMLDTMA